LAEKFRAFGLPAEEIDGHDSSAIRRALHARHPGPDVIVAHTRKGRGVSFMEDRMEWHYLSMTEAQYLEAIEEVEKACETPSAKPWSQPLAAQSLCS
jgi:transketolase